MRNKQIVKILLGVTLSVIAAVTLASVTSYRVPSRDDSISNS